MEKRVMIATFLSMLVVLVFWQQWQKPVQPVKEQIAKTIPAELTPEKSIKEALIPAPIKNIEITTASSRIVLSTKGASVVDWRVKEKTGQWAVIFSTGTTFGDTALRMRTTQEPYLENIIFSTDREKISVEPDSSAEVVFKAKLKTGLEIQRVYRIAGQGYEHSAEIRFRNSSRQALRVPENHLLWGPGLNPLNEKNDTSAVAAFFNNKVHKKLKTGKHEGDISWAAIENTYFLVAFIPERTEFDGVIVERAKDKRSSAGLIQKDFMLNPGEVAKYNLRLYVGEKSYKVLKKTAPQLEEIVGFGVIGKVFYTVLTNIQGVVKNYGWAIIILTLIIQILLFPLTMKSYKSMKEMQLVQPLMKELQEKYKDDPKRLNIEVMNLYRTHKVNPFGGCLPMLLQLPVFFALYNTIRYAVELRNSPFIFWIRDLSVPDTIAVIGNININILPLLMGVIMFLQQKLSSVDPQQAKMFLFMPVIFTIMFWNFPSGLVLYWFMNSLVSFAGQYFIINKRGPSRQPQIIDVKKER